MEAESKATQLKNRTVDLLQKAGSVLNRYRHVVILVMAATCVILVGGKRRCFSIFLGELHQDFNVTKLELNWIGDSYAAVGFFLMPAAATGILWLHHCYREASLLAGCLIFVSCFATSWVSSPGWMFLTHTAIHGVGSALAMTAAALVVGEHFDARHKLHVLATTLVSGGPYGAIIFCPLYANWVRTLGWREAFRMMGVLFLVVMALAAAAYQCKAARTGQYQDLDAEEAEEAAAGGSGRRVLAFCTLSELQSRPLILVWLLQRVLHNVAMYSLAMNLYDLQLDFRLQEVGVTEAKRSAANVQLCYTVGESLCYTVGLIFGDKIRGRLILAYVTGAAVFTAVTFAWHFMLPVLHAQYVLGLLAGAAVGSGNTMMYATAEEVMDVDGAVAFPMSKMAAGVGMLVAPQLSGLVIDKVSFSGFFLVQSGVSAVSFSLLAGIAVVMRQQQQQQQQQQQEELQMQQEAELDSAAVDAAGGGSLVP